MRSPHGALLIMLGSIVTGSAIVAHLLPGPYGAAVVAIGLAVMGFLGAGALLFHFGADSAEKAGEPLFPPVPDSTEESRDPNRLTKE